MPYLANRVPDREAEAPQHFGARSVADTLEAYPGRELVARRRMKFFLVAASCAALLAPPGAGAFTFSDGTHIDCVAGGRTVAEQEAKGDAALAGFTGRTLVQEAGGYTIVWNMARLASLPPVMHDYLFFHECAHARVPTRDEITANCVGLKDMRAAGRAGVAVEARIAQFYGPGNAYWARTLQCADATATPGPRPAR